MNHYDYMSLAMQEAKKALTSREIPIGAIIVLHDSVIAAFVNNNLLERTVRQNEGKVMTIFPNDEGKFNYEETDFLELGCRKN